MISLTVRYFASTREQVGQSSERIELTAPFTVAHLLEELTARHPSLAALTRHLRVAVSHEFVADSAALLRDDDEVALIPPVSGG